jgi:phage/plasmid primase-like uncharacterized protein
MSTPREHILNDELKNIVLRENAERLFKASKKITEKEGTAAKLYLTETRKIPISTLKSSNIRSLEGEITLLKYDENTGEISEEQRKFSSTLTPVCGYDGKLVGVHLVHLNGSKKASNDNDCKQFIGEESEGKVALVQSSLDTTKVYIAEGIETAASVASFSGIQGKYDVLASLGITELSKSLAYVKQIIPLVALSYCLKIMTYLSQVKRRVMPIVLL